MTLAIGAHRVDPPVVLAPMAGITNAAFRTLCRGYGGALFVSEMVTARALVERHPETLRMVRAEEGATTRSVQLYAVDPSTAAAAVRLLVEEDRADHVDLNFGCPVPKVTRKGGGAALPWKRGLFRAVVGAAVRAADGAVPVTVKMRMGIDPHHLTYLDAGRIAVEEGVAAVALHARTATQHYAGAAHWDAIAGLKQACAGVPVLGNGDIWTGADAVRMMRTTGCDGVVVGRGCLGRPWLFAELEAALTGRPAPAPPDLGGVADTMRRHARLLGAHLADEVRGVVELRKHVAWYLKGFPVGAALRSRLAMASTYAELDTLLDALDRDVPYPDEAARTPRGRTSPRDRVPLPEGWLDDTDGAGLVLAGTDGGSGG